MTAAALSSSTGASSRMTSRIVAPVIMTEITLQCSDGIKLAAQSWKKEKTTNASEHQQQQVDANANEKHEVSSKKMSSRRILCLHGWMDNCRSFHHFAPNLLQRLPDTDDAELVALDFVGHGLSSHKSMDGPPTLLSEAAFYIAEAVQQLKWHHETKQFTIVGHSMGAALGSLYAASFPEQVQKLVLLDGAGPLARNPKDVAKHVRQHVKRRQVGIRPPRVYPSLQMAIETRCQTAKNFPGNQYLSETAAREMVLRGSRPVAAVPTTTEGGTSNSSGGVQFRHDPRLQWPSLQYFTPEQVDALLEDIQCPTALLLAADGWPFDQDRYQRTLDLLKPVVHQTLPGSHHFHADVATADAVVDAVVDFLSRD